jgi:hypothetical protein
MQQHCLDARKIGFGRKMRRRVAERSDLPGDGKRLSNPVDGSRS